MLKDQDQRVEDCETERTGERKRRRREREGGTQRRERKEKQEPARREGEEATLLGDAPLFRAHPDNHPQNSHLEQAVSSSFFQMRKLQCLGVK